jgi:hypothetical protein
MQAVDESLIVVPQLDVLFDVTVTSSEGKQKE